LETQCSHLQQPQSNSHTEKLYILHRSADTGVRAKGGEEKPKCLIPHPPTQPISSSSESFLPILKRLNIL
jgi:hypothetical protein